MKEKIFLVLANLFWAGNYLIGNTSSQKLVLYGSHSFVGVSRSYSFFPSPIFWNGHATEKS